MKKFIKADNDVAKMKQRHLDAYERRANKKQNALEDIKTADDPLQVAFDAFVPDSGKADTFIGEVARAFMKILYRDMNDGDRFYSGYGIETCGDCVAFLCDALPDLFDEFEDIANRNLEGKAYTEAIQTIAENTIDYLANNPELALRDNDEDMYDFNGEGFMKEHDWISMYEFECDYPEELSAHLEAGNISTRDVEDEVQYWEILRNDENAIVDANDYGLSIRDVTEETYYELENSMVNELEYWASELTNEYGDPYEDEEEY